MSSLSDDCQFFHRRNADGTLDSVCLECFQTVASATDTDDMEQFEYEHVCASEERAHLDEWRPTLGNVVDFRAARSA
jgi:hypothetical protein